MSAKFSFGGAAMIAMALCLSGCNSEQAKQEEAPPPAVDASRHFYRAASFSNAVVQASGETFTVQRAGDARQGLSILPHEGEGPVRIDFTVAGQGARVSAYRDGNWINLPAQESYAVRLGPGGAFHILVIPAANSAATVNVTGTTTCRGAPPETCPALPGAP